MLAFIETGSFFRMGCLQPRYSPNKKSRTAPALRYCRITRSNSLIRLAVGQTQTTRHRHTRVMLTYVCKCYGTKRSSPALLFGVGMVMFVLRPTRTLPASSMDKACA